MKNSSIIKKSKSQFRPSLTNHINLTSSPKKNILMLLHPKPKTKKNKGFIKIIRNDPVETRKFQAFLNFSKLPIKKLKAEPLIT